MTDTPNGGHTPPWGYAAYLTGRLESLGLSRNALARALGHRGASQVSRWCAGKAVPREKARTKIEAALAHTEPFTKYRKPPETPQDAPGTTIWGGTGYDSPQTLEGATIDADGALRVEFDGPPKVERYVVEGG